MSTKKYFKEIFEKNPKQDPIIDAVRALSVLSIIAFHVTVGVLQIFDHEKATQYILNMPRLLQPLWHGEKGVDAFFLISALVLGAPLFKKIEQFDWSAAKVFYVKRFYRIYPLFFIALVLYTVGQWSYFGKYFFSNLFLINNLIPGERTIIPVGWSLLVEVQYYALLPILLFIIKKSAQPVKVLSAVVMGSFLACAAALLSHPELYLRPITDLFLAEDRSEFSKKMGEFFYEADSTRFGPFAIGLLLAYLRLKHSEKLQNFFKNKDTWVFLVASALIGFSVAVPIYDPNSWYYHTFSNQLHFLILISQRQIFALGLALLMLGCWYSGGVFKVISKIFQLQIWSPISRLSFPIYLFHFPFIAVAAVMVFRTTNVKEVLDVSFLQGGAIFLLATALTILFSIPLYIYVERPLIERGKK